MSGEPLRMAIIGLGRMGRFHLAALDGVEDIEVVALVEPAGAALVAAGAGRPNAALFHDVPTALADAGIAACLIASPTPTHPQVVAAALEAGLHVLCEKPLALDADEARRLGEKAVDRGLVLQIGFWRRFSPPWTAMKERIDAGAIGTPLLVRLSQWDAEAPPAAFCDPAVSGGLAIDCGVHEFDLATWLTGRRITSVSAWSLPIVDAAVGAAGDVDNLVAVLDLEGGAVATVDLSRNARYGDDVRTEVLGSEGALFVDALPTGRTRLATAEGVHVVPGAAVDDVMAAGVVGQVRAFAGAVRGEGGAVPGAAASAMATRIGQLVMEAARRGGSVPVDGHDP